MTEYEMLMRMRKRPGMYLGSESISKLQTFLDGYHTALIDFGKNENRKMLLPLDFWYMHEFAAVVYGYYESTSGWRRIILDGCGGDERTALNKFFELYEMFMHIRIKSVRRAVLDEENIAHCEKYGPYREKYIFEEKRFERIGAVFHEPREAYIFRLTTEGGEYEFDMLEVECENAAVETQFLFSDRGERASRKTAEQYAEGLFGRLFFSGYDDTGNYEFKNRLIGHHY